MSLHGDIQVERFHSSSLPTDSEDSSFLFSAAKNLLIDAPTVEIGLRRGGGTEAIVLGLAAAGRRGHTHLAIDPYGDIDYISWDRISHCDYTNDMRDDALPRIRRFCAEHSINFIYLPLEDTEFFERFSDGVPVYANRRKIKAEKYALVHFDGPHGVVPVTQEIEFFAARSPVGCHWVFDDPQQYNHDGILDPWIRRLGFELFRSRHKRWYIRVKESSLGAEVS
ncbi:MAG TPA: hypothetical protein VGJ91_14450 [Polyangiaceae bacterium]